LITNTFKKGETSGDSRRLGEGSGRRGSAKGEIETQNPYGEGRG